MENDKTKEQVEAAWNFVDSLSLPMGTAGVKHELAAFLASRDAEKDARITALESALAEERRKRDYWRESDIERCHQLAEKLGEIKALRDVIAAEKGLRKSAESALAEEKAKYENRPAICAFCSWEGPAAEIRVCCGLLKKYGHRARCIVGDTLASLPPVAKKPVAPKPCPECGGPK